MLGDACGSSITKVFRVEGGRVRGVGGESMARTCARTPLSPLLSLALPVPARHWRHNTTTNTGIQKHVSFSSSCALSGLIGKARQTTYTAATSALALA